MTAAPRPLHAPIRWIALGGACIAAAYVLTAANPEGRAAPWAMVAGLSALVFGTVSLGATGKGAAASRAVAGTCILVGFGAALLVPADLRGPLGIPMGTVLVAVLVGLVPLVVLPLLFARFEGRDLHAADPAGPDRQDAGRTP